MEDKFKSRGIPIKIYSFPRAGLMRKFLILLALFFVIGLSNIIYAEGFQQAIVTGTVTDQQGAPLAGVTIMVKGTQIGTLTDASGKFTIPNVPKNATLVFSFVGMKQQEIPVGASNQVNAIMTESAIGLGEVVVVGFGTQKKVNLTGSVSSVSSEELGKRPVTNAASMLEGKVPGIQIVQNSAAPGNESVSIQIRGRRSYGTSNDPLILIDGVQGSLTNLNPSMIESVSVLKDASSSAIYGSRAANGVILVTTKRGTSNNRLNIEYNYNVGVQTSTFLPELVTNSAEYMTMLNTARVNSRGPGNEAYTQAQIDSYKNAAGNPMYPNTDWNKLIYRNGVTQNHYLSLNGGNDATTYNLGLGYVDQIGVIKHYDAKKYNVLFNMTSKLSKIVTLSTNIRLSRMMRDESQGGVTNLVLTTWGAHPTYGPRIVLPGSPNLGQYTRYAFANVYNNWQPTIAAENGGDKYIDYNAVASIGLKIKLLEGLEWETLGTANYTFSYFKSTGYSIPTYDWFTGNYVASIQNASTGIAVTRTNTENDFYNLFSTLKYNKIFAEKNEITALLGYSQEQNINDNLSGYRRNMANPNTTQINDGGTAGQTTSGTGYQWAIQSIFGRVNYAYSEKYLAEFSFRYDGSSRFSQGNKWGLFPSFSLGWRMNKESFLSDVSWINDLKLRGSWGKLGNQEIGNYPYQQTLSIGLNYPIAGTVQSGAYVSRLSNNNITWETTTITDIGIDFSLFKNKIYGTFDYYDKVTTGILGSAQVPGFVGLSAPTVNYGTMKNEGFDFMVGHRNAIGSFNYDINFNLGHYKNTLVKYGQTQDGGTYLNKEGLPFQSYYAWQWVGIFQSQEEIAAAPLHQYNPKPGDFRYADINGDGKIDANDRTVIPGMYPKFDFGGTITLSWKNFDLSAFFQGSEGKKYNVIFWGFEPFFQEGKPPTFWRNAWTPTNPSKTLPRLYLPGEENAITNGQQGSSWYLQDASYTRLKNLVFGYNVPKEICLKIGLQGIRVYYSGDNLFTITQYYKKMTGSSNVGGDPERSSTSGSQWFANYPQVITHSFGVRLNF
jgi:TonB-linked SusC/RagA family outer membrane protein